MEAARPTTNRPEDNLPNGPLTAKERDDRLTFAVSTFSNCRTREEQLAAIMAHEGVKRKQALRIYDDAKEYIRQSFTDYQANCVEDAYQFLTDIKLNPLHKTADRLAAQKQLNELFLPIREQKVAVTGVTTVVNVGIQQAVLANEKALAAALALEEALAPPQLPEARGTQEKAHDGPAGGQ